MYVIGIEGGGSKSDLLMSDLTGKIVAQCSGGALNLYSSGTQAALANLAELIAQALAIVDTGIGQIAGICLGSAGLGRDQERQAVASFLRDLGMRGKLLLVSDAEITLQAALGGQQGVLLIAGTGSVAFSLNQDGQVRRCGGWGHILGDEGSAYDLGRKALQMALQAYDGRCSETLLLPMVMEYSGLNSPNQLVPYIYQNFDKARVAEFAPLVEQAAYREDAVAIRILQETTLAYYQMIKVLLEDLDQSAPIQVIGHGAIMEKSQVIYKSLIMKLSAEYPEIAFGHLTEPPVSGALSLALGLIHSADE